jgi:hypothetical protein
MNLMAYVDWSEWSHHTVEFAIVRGIVDSA